jgi:hypothetical protein
MKIGRNSKECKKIEEDNIKKKEMNKLDKDKDNNKDKLEKATKEEMKDCISSIHLMKLVIKQEKLLKAK